MVNLSSARTLLKIPYGFVETLINKFPRFYLGCLTLLALFGYAFVLLFPLLVLAGLFNIYQALAVNEVTNWPSVLTWLAVIPVAALVSYRCTQVRLPPANGLSLADDKAPELFKLVQQHQNYFKRPVINRIVITENYELDIVKMPIWALPVWSTSTLVIGLPVLQSLSQNQFECVVARRIGQFSKRYNLLTNWLYQLRAIWQQYRVGYGQQNGLGIEPMRWYYAVYAPLYAKASRHAAWLDELNADTYAMEVYNDEEVLDMITADALCRWYLHNQFWPAVYKIAAIEKKSLAAPHAKMASAVHTIKNGERTDSLIDSVYKQSARSRDAMPSLRDRIKNIGHEKPQMEKDASENAAAYYLGNSVKGVIDVVDKLWLKSFLEQRKRQHQQKQVAAEQTTSA